MGIHNRDYIRDDGDGYSSSGSGYRVNAEWSMCRWLITINIVVFILQAFLREQGKISPVTYWLNLSQGNFLQGQVWRVLTYAFCHDFKEILHIIFNMFFLYMFGRELEQIYGKKEFLLLYLVSAVFSGFAYLGVSYLTHDTASVVGASGAVMAILMLFALHFPHQKVNVYFLFPVEIRWLIMFYVIVDSLPILQALAGNNLHDGVAHSAHVGGLLIGFLYWKFHWRFENFLPGNISLPKLKNKHQRGFKVYQPKDQEHVKQQDDKLDQTVDEILAKISKSGEESLTSKERKILKKASEKYKNR